MRLLLTFHVLDGIMKFRKREILVRAVWLLFVRQVCMGWNVQAAGGGAGRKDEMPPPRI